jgi:signal transduction histidine kinase
LLKVALTKNNAIVLVFVISVAVLLSILSYQYAVSNSNRIIQIASEDIRSNARIETSDLSRSLTNVLDSVSSNLYILAKAPTIQSNEFQRAQVLMNIADDSTSRLVDFYMWLDQNGKIIWISNINQTNYQKYKGFDLSYRSYFSIPKQTHAAYYSTTIESNDKIPRLYLSYPIILTNTIGKENTTASNEKMFKGVIVAGIRVDTLGNLLKNQLLPEFKSTIGLLDKNGIIIYNGNMPYTASSQSYIGKYIFGDEFQSALTTILSSDAKRTLNDLLKSSLRGNAGSGDIFAQATMNTIAFAPVRIGGEHFLTLYVNTPHNLASEVGNLISLQKNFSTLIVTIVGAVAFAIAFLVLTWNKGLKIIVKTRTEELRRSNESLTESNKQLASANEQLKIQDKMQKEFINIAAHELRTPMQPIIGLTEVIKSKMANAGEKKDQIELLDIVIRNAKRLQRLSEDILDVTKIESKALNLKMDILNLKEVISKTVEDYRNQIQKTNSNVKLLYEPDQEKGKRKGEEAEHDTILVYGDRTKLTQVISNLLNNALKFTRDGTVSVATRKKEGGQKVLVSVKDTGDGIDPEILPRLFSKFATKSFQGTGLGLFISKSIIEAHGGKIWAENNKTDGETGAIFYFDLRLIDQQHLDAKAFEQNSNQSII